MNDATNDRDLELRELLETLAPPAPSRILDSRVTDSFRRFHQRSRWRRLLTAKITVPIPIVALLLLVALPVARLALSLRDVPPPPRIEERVRVVEVPIVREKVVTRWARVPAASVGRERASSEVKLDRFRSAGELKIRILNRGASDD